ncbi:hypothetical protein Barb7_03125 [Bacteroidales bacterium Barb7]|nr:hypothetical protein Barb7_03125 [Bacteroidales bacterium Barb7]
MGYFLNFNKGTNIRGLTYRTPSLTPHSATLHVGLKSLAPSGLLHNYFSTVKLDIVTLTNSTRFSASSRQIMTLLLYISCQNNTSISYLS